MDRKEEIREFLISRRAKISPEQAGIPSYGELRRVPGLRREEVAQRRGKHGLLHAAGTRQYPRRLRFGA